MAGPSAACCPAGGLSAAPPRGRAASPGGRPWAPRGRGCRPRRRQRAVAVRGVSWEGHVLGPGLKSAGEWLGSHTGKGVTGRALPGLGTGGSERRHGGELLETRPAGRRRVRDLAGAAGVSVL